MSMSGTTWKRIVVIDDKDNNDPVLRRVILLPLFYYISKEFQRRLVLSGETVSLQQIVSVRVSLEEALDSGAVEIGTDGDVWFAPEYMLLQELEPGSDGTYKRICTEHFLTTDEVLAHWRAENAARVTR